jgi:DnaJ family protein C protein 28
VDEGHCYGTPLIRKKGQRVAGDHHRRNDVAEAMYQALQEEMAREPSAMARGVKGKRPMAQEPDSQEPAVPPEAKPPQRRPVGMGWASLVDEKIRAAMARGEFDDLAGAGKPLVIEENPYAGDRAMGYNFLKSHGLAPREIELGHEIDDLLRRAEALLDELQRRREVLARKRVVLPRDQRLYEATRQRTAKAYETLLRTAYDRILSLNISAPTALHRQIINVQALLDAFAERFPPVSA